MPGFAWQEGYAAFTVSPQARLDVQRYIAKQEDHHRTTPFRDELRKMLNRAQIEFDERYFD